MARIGLCLSLSLSLHLGCGRASSEHEGAPPRSATAIAASARAPAPVASVAAPTNSAAAPEPSLPPLAADSDTISLEVEGFRAAVVSLPLGATEPRPLIVALHGNFDRPDWHCELWPRVLGRHAFVLCPRGVPRLDVSKSLDRWEYAGVDKTSRELEAAIAALEARFPGRVEPGPIVFLGFSLGAILGVRIVKAAPARYSRVVLIEGGQEGLDAAFLRRFPAEGGERILIACGQAPCVTKARLNLKRLEKADISARLVDGGALGHTYDGAIAEGIAREWSWLTQGLPGWPNMAPKPE